MGCFNVMIAILLSTYFMISCLLPAYCHSYSYIIIIACLLPPQLAITVFAHCAFVASILSLVGLSL